MLATRAADDLVCLAFVNTVGGQDELIFDGQSFVFNENGECVGAGPEPFEEDLLVVDLDLDEVFRARLHDSRRRKEKLRSHRGPVDAASRSPRCPTPRAARSCRRARCRRPRAGGGDLPGPRARHARLRHEERLHATWCSGCPAASTRRWWPPSRATRWAPPTSPGSPCPRRFPRRHAPGRGAARPEPRHRVPAPARSRRCSRRTSGPSPSPSRDSRRT